MVRVLASNSGWMVERFKPFPALRELLCRAATVVKDLGGRAIGTPVCRMLSGMIKGKAIYGWWWIRIYLLCAEQSITCCLWETAWWEPFTCLRLGGEGMAVSAPVQDWDSRYCFVHTAVWGVLGPQPWVPAHSSSRGSEPRVAKVFWESCSVCLYKTLSSSWIQRFTLNYLALAQKSLRC